MIELGYCLDLTTSMGIQAIKAAHTHFVNYCKSAGVDVPTNRGGPDRLLRNLDCAVVNYLHEVLKQDHQRPFQSVKGVFIEGGAIYEDSGFYERTHIQICVRDFGCIKGVFRVSDDDLK